MRITIITSAYIEVSTGWIDIKSITPPNEPLVEAVSHITRIVLTPNTKTTGIIQMAKIRNRVIVQERKNRRKRVMNDFATITCSVKAADTTRRKEESF